MIFSHDESNEEDNDVTFDDGLDNAKFIVFVCESLAVYSSFTKKKYAYGDGGGGR